VTLAYVGIGGRNLSRQHARQLVALTQGLRVRISLIAVQDDSGRYASPSEEEVATFRDEMSKAGIPVVRRYSGGGEIGAACGTLSASQKGGELVALARSKGPPLLEDVP
jgi:23S rRNA (adenine2503-C2)-methyltransferase